MKKRLLLTGMVFAVIFTGCSKDDDAVDTEYPVIDVSSATSFPKQCSEITRGQTFTFRANFSDNAELGSSSIDIHHNFDHHSHSTEVEGCNMDPVKAPVKPFLLVKTYPIPGGLRNYKIREDITVPADVDPGDYHFLIRLTDKEGWQTLKGLSIKVK